MTAPKENVNPAPVDESMSIENALAWIREYPRAEGHESLLLSDCLGRVLAEDLVASEPVPAHPSSAMDGFAFRHRDAAAQLRLPLQGHVAAGHPLNEPLRAGHAARILTGGVIPVHADTVAKQEDCQVDGDIVTLPTHLAVGANCRQIGDDILQGATVMRAGTRLRPQDLGVAASIGLGTLTVHRRLKVGLVATGDELRSPEATLPVGCVRNSNSPTLNALASSLGAEVTDYGVVHDDPSETRAALLRAAGENDVILSTGGVSVGDEDHVRHALQEIGELAFWKLPIKPGRPIAVGRVGRTPFVGLPGNPVSALVAFWLIGRPILLHLSGATQLETVRFSVIADFEHRRSRGRREFLCGHLRADGSGDLQATVPRRGGSGMLTALAASDGLIEILENDGDIGVGDRVRFLPLTSLLY